MARTIPVVVGDRKVLEASPFSGSFEFAPFGEGLPGQAELIDLGIIDSPLFGRLDAAYGKAAFRYIEEALKLVLSDRVAAIVTCPLNKASLRMAGIPFTGHTEMLAHFGGVTDFVMMMANQEMRVSLVTIHIPLKEVAPSLSVDRIFKTISITDASLKDRFNVAKPVIKVCGLNPHAGEQGTIGSEEELIEEALLMARSAGIDAKGPFPADTVFHRRDCDAFVAMYHDQGLIPVKTIDFERTVNITLGLPFIRTSPGHGTGFDIAGIGVANPSGLISAYDMAEQMCLGSSRRSPVNGQRSATL